MVPRTDRTVSVKARPEINSNALLHIAFPGREDGVEEAGVNGRKWCGVKEKLLSQGWMAGDGWDGHQIAVV